jgi:hypothetical protein
MDEKNHFRRKIGNLVVILDSLIVLLAALRLTGYTWQELMPKNNAI